MADIFSMQLIGSLASLRPTAADRVILARAALKTAREAAREHDMGAALLFIEEALHQLRAPGNEPV